MATIILNKWDGGQAEDIRTTSINQNEESLNFDVFNNPSMLVPYPDVVAETVASGSSARYSLGDVSISSIEPGSSFTAVGYKDEQVGDFSPQFMFKSSATGTWTKVGYGSGTSENLIIGSLVMYKDKPYCISYASGDYRLKKLNPSSTLTTVGSITTGTPYAACKPVVHPEDNILYMGFGYNISRWNDSNFTTYSTQVPINMSIKAMTPYGGYLAIGCNQTTGYGNSIVYLWGRDGSINTFQSQIDFGEGTIVHMENLNNSLIVIMTSSNYLDTTKDPKLLVKTYSGGGVITLKTINISSTTVLFGNRNTKASDKLYFAGSNDDCLYCVGKNKDGSFIINQDRFIFNGSSIGSTVEGLDIIGDTLFVGFINPTTAFSNFYRTGIGTEITYTATSKYKTTINPNMPIADRYKEKQLEAFRVSYTGASSGSVVLKYSVDGSTFTTAISKTNTTGEHTIEATSQEDGSPFDIKQGREFQFQVESTGGAKIKEIAYRYSTKDTTI